MLPNRSPELGYTETAGAWQCRRAAVCMFLTRMFMGGSHNAAYRDLQTPFASTPAGDRVRNGVSQVCGWTAALARVEPQKPLVAFRRGFCGNRLARVARYLLAAVKYVTAQ
jgi:hypothetical protein